MNNIEQLLVDMRESLEREMRQGFADVNARLDEVNARLDTQSTRLERMAGAVNVGTRWISRMDGWADKIDVAMEARDREIAELRQRIERLEKKSA